MALDIDRMEHNVLYKTLDEREAYFTTGITYVAKCKRFKKGLSLIKPIIYVYHFDLDGKLDCVLYGKLISRKYQCNVEYSILGWRINKNSNFDEIGLKETVEEITCSWERLEPASPQESEQLNKEICDFFNNPREYLKDDELKRKRNLGN